MLLILEGVDGAGKSTLAARLADELHRRDPAARVEVLHRGPPGDANPLDEYEVPLLSYRPGRDHHIICDRWHLGELVYPRVLGRPSLLDVAHLAHIELTLRSRGAVLVHVAPPLDVIYRRLRDRPDDSPGAAPGVIDRVHERFAAEVAETTIELAFTGGTPSNDVCIDAILRVAAHTERACVGLNDFITYVGPPRPRALLLGDRRGVAGTPDEHGLGPAFMPYPSTSGAYLLRALPRSHRDQIGLANARDVDDWHELWRVLDRPNIVTLGANATRVVAGRRPLCHGSLPHPQFVRRFFYDACDDYGARLAAVIDHPHDESHWRPARLARLI